MATPELPVGYYDEGRAYLESVQKLGLRPDAFFWAFDQVTGSFVLVLVTEAFDAVGPLELSKLLFKAYNADATPRAIDPFIIRLHSTDHQIVREMDKIMPFRVAVSENGKEIPNLVRAVTSLGGLDIDGAWVYLYTKPLSKKRSTSEILRHFHRFEREINRIAA